jgi:hypothetical protein
MTTVCTTLKMAVVAPMPNARQRIAAEVKPGFLLRTLTPYRASCSMEVIISFTYAADPEWFRSSY